MITFGADSLGASLPSHGLADLVWSVPLRHFALGCVQSRGLLCGDMTENANEVDKNEPESLDRTAYRKIRDTTKSTPQSFRSTTLRFSYQLQSSKRTHKLSEKS